MDIKYILTKALSIILISAFSVNNLSYGYELTAPKQYNLAPPTIFQESFAPESSPQFKKSPLSDMKFLTAAFSIASHFLLDFESEEILVKAVRDQFRSNKEFLDGIKLESARVENNIVLIPFERDGIGYEAKICGKETFEALDKTGSQWAVSKRFGIQIKEISERQNGESKTINMPDKDLKGPGAPESNSVIESLIKDERIVESYLEKEKLNASRVKWIDGYKAGTPRSIYTTGEIDINSLFSESEAKNLKTWIEEHKISEDYVTFRILPNEPALAWRKRFENSNVSHASSDDKSIYMGHFFLKYLMSDAPDRAELRKEVLDEHELQLILHPDKVDEIESGEAYERLTKKVAEIIGQLYAVNRVRKNLAYLWDGEFKPLHDRANEMFNDTALINKESVAELTKDYEAYLKGGEEQKKFKASQGLKDSEVVLYDSMEYAITHALPFFAGGLGALAGDHGRAASDLLPNNTLICVGAHYKFGYLTQRINASRIQESKEARITIEQFGEIIKDDYGNDIVIELPMPDNKSIDLKAWEIQAGRTRMFFLTTDIDENNANPEYRRYLNHTYDKNDRVRIVQEYIIGVGSERLLDRLGMKSRTVHLNEGHTAFVLLEKARQLMIKKIKYINEKLGLDFNIDSLSEIPMEERAKYGLELCHALEVVKNMIGFTSHTPISAGNEKFRLDIAQEFLSAYLATFGGEFKDIGFGPIVHDGVFDMTEFAMSYCNFRNAVSRKHQEVSKVMYENSDKMASESLGRNRPEMEYITNAIHRGYYQPEEIQELLIKKLVELKSAGTISGNVTLDEISWEDSWKLVRSISDEELKDVSEMMMKNGIEELKKVRSLKSKYGRILPLVDGKELEIDREAFILVFGRRMAMYKRPDFVLANISDFNTEAWRKAVREAKKNGKKAQIIFAGKAHPDDMDGINVLQRILHIAETDPELKGTILFIENYDTEVAKALVKIATAALNNPEHGREASGTSGMKFLSAGKPSITIMDGWPLEAAQGVFPFVTKEQLRDILVGSWRFVRMAVSLVGKEYTADKLNGSIPSQEKEEVLLYECLDPECGNVWTVAARENAPIACEKCSRPAIKNNPYHELGLLDVYFNHKERWYQIMRESLAQGLSFFTSHRMFKEYAERMYKPNIQAGRLAEYEFMRLGLEGIPEGLQFAEESMEKIHAIDLNLIPPLEKDEVIWHIIPDELIPYQENGNLRNDFKKLVREVNSLPGIREKIYIMNDRQEVSNVIEGIRRTEQEKNPNIKIKFSAALTSVAQLSQIPKEARALVFTREGGNLVQLEGVLAALRALHNPDKEYAAKMLMELHRTLAKNRLEGTIESIAENLDNPQNLAKYILFELKPITIHDAADLERLNRNLIRLLQAA